MWNPNVDLERLITHFNGRATKLSKLIVIILKHVQDLYWEDLE